MRLSGRDLELSYDDAVVVRDLSIEVPDGRISVLIGPNGSGKSTLLRALARLLKPSGGEVVLDGQTIQRLPTKEVARRLAILPQLLTSPDAITVEDLVWYGRHPHRHPLLAPSRADRDAVDWALEATRMEELRRHPVDQLSGGQRQRAWIALALAQGTDLLLLDEPTTFLDLAYQLEVLELLHELNERGKTVVMVLHDVNMAGEYAHRLFVVHGGRMVAQGSPEEVLTVDTMRKVFGVEVQLLSHPVSGKPLCIPVRAPARVRSDADSAEPGTQVVAVGRDT